jgi:predicted RNase H-like nuclease
VAVLGVDGWRGRWVGALLDGRRVRLLDLPDVAAVLAVPDVAVIGIDMPIGLSDDGARRCDVEARARLGRAGSSVFPAPVRRVLGCRDYAEACAVARAASGKAVSRQAWNLVPAIRAVDDALDDDALDDGAGRVHEVHPELAFRALDERVRQRKATAPGQAQRLRALLPAMEVLDALAAGPAGVPMIDAVDACAVAWSAQRIEDGRAESVGGDARDSRGRAMRIAW